MSGLARTFQTARTEVIGGKSIRFARLEVGTDLADITTTVIEERKAKANKLVDEQNNNPDRRMHIGRFELLSILQKIEDNEPSVAELYARASTPKGAHGVCLVMLKKAGHSDDEASQILREMRSDVMVGVAQDGVLCAEPQKEKPEDKTPPLASTPAGSSPPTTPAGVPSEAELQAKAVGYAQ